MRRRRVLIVSLGGTIAMTGEPGKGARPTLEAADLLSPLRDLSDADLTPRSFRQVPGAELRVEDIGALAGMVGSAPKEGFDGIVVTQGTDTIEETAFALDLLLEGDLPLVVTGAMVNPSRPGGDGPANLLDAVAVAASGCTGEIGPVVVFGGEVHAARFVRKTHTTSYRAFTSISGPLGWVAEGKPLLLTKPAVRVRLPQAPLVAEGPAAVALLTATAGDDGRLLKAVNGAYDGLVMEALGAGHVPSALVAPLADLAATMPVLLCSRTGNGPVLRRTYGFPGSERDLLDRGLISGGYLDGPKARIALTLLLRTGAGREEIRDLMQQFYGAIS
ncbi:MAG: asparaginase [Acidimicrobiales bacterium]